MITATKKAHFNCSAKTLFNIVTNNKEYGWRSDLKKIDLVDGGVSFIEYTKKGYPTLFTITNRIPYTRYEFKIHNNTMTGKWIGIFEETDGETDIEFIETVSIKGWIKRHFAPYYLNRQQDKYVEDLKKAVKEKTKREE